MPATAKAFQKVAEGIAVLEVCIAVRRVSKLVSGCSRLYPIKFRKSLKYEAFIHNDTTTRGANNIITCRHTDWRGPVVLR